MRELQTAIAWICIATNLKPKKVEEITNGVVTARQLYHWQETDPNNQRPNHGGAGNFLFEPEFQQKVENTLGEMVSGDEGRTISWYAMIGIEF